MNHRIMMMMLASAVAGCIDSGVPASSEAPAQAPDVERTIVRLQPDGSEQVTTLRVTEAQHRQELADRERRTHGTTTGGLGEVDQGLASVDNSCAASSMWIFDNTGNVRGTGLFGHEICFFKSSTAFPVCTDLRQYTRTCFLGGGCQTWANDSGNWIGSYWAGQDTGMYLDVNGAVQEGFGPYFRQDNAQLTVPRAVYLCFPN